MTKTKLAVASAFLTCAFCFLPAALRSQTAPPSTEVFLAPLTINGTTVTVGAPVNISNNPGYDNQPSFLPNSSAVLFASNRDGKQNDIYRYDIKKKRLVQLTKTPENEYSPLVAPDGKSFLCVHGAEQSIFRYDMDGSHPRLAYQHGQALIGYHVWTSPTELAAFVLGANGTPNQLQLIDTKTGKGRVIDTNIGRSLLIRPQTDTVTYVAKLTRDQWLVREFNPSEPVGGSTITATVKGSEDLTWLPNGGMLMASGSKLFLWQDTMPIWTEIADLSGAGVKRITRLSASRDGKHLAIVGEP